MAWYSNPDLWKSVASFIPSLLGGGQQAQQAPVPGQVPTSQVAPTQGQANPYSMVPAQQQPAPEAPVIPSIDYQVMAQDILNNLPTNPNKTQFDRTGEIVRDAKESASKQQETERAAATQAMEDARAKDAEKTGKKAESKESGTSLKQAMMSPEVIAALAQLAMGPQRQAAPMSTMSLPTSSFRAPVNPYTGK